MSTRLLAGLLSTGMMFASLTTAADASKRTSRSSSDMQRAIAWEHHKDAAAARQARIEARHPSSTYTNADRSADRGSDQNMVKDKKAPGVRRDR